MANDTQFYILGLILVLFATRYFWLVVASWGVFLVSSWVTTAFISVHYEYIARVQEPFALFDELYDKPWTRVGPYLVGMAIGWYLQRNKCKIHMNLVVATGGWALALGCFATLVYSVLHVKMTVIGSAAYMALGHTAWGAALGWVVVASCCGYGGFINKLLSFKAMVPMSRLTYCAYLVHPILMLITSSQMDGPLHLHTSMVLIIFLGNLMMSYTVSFMISLVLEAPLVNILKICMEPRKKAKFTFNSGSYLYKRVAC
ncbi:Uncharacterized protein GBIM_13732 [Gryllus bimaculatus]|nr:Uncharacterized protein GBIM_13732 [Gryllus bimaculatus]